MPEIETKTFFFECENIHTRKKIEMRPESVIQQKKLATTERIRTIDFARSGIGGTGNLSPRARRTLAVYIALVKMGYSGLSAPMGAIADAVYRSSHGEAGSIRTLQRAHVELEEKGFIDCARFRDGERARGALIEFNLEAFSFWTKQKSHNISPMPTQSHISPGTTSCHPSDRTRDQVASNSQDPLEKVSTKPRAGARASKRTSRGKKHPVVFSVGKALDKMQGVHRADKRAARARAQCELMAIAAGISIVNPSGVDWTYWASRWNDFSWQVRESTAAREIIPMLLGQPDKMRRSTASENTAQIILETIPQDTEIKSPTEEDIRAVRESLEKKFSLPIDAQSPSSVSNAKQNYPEVDEADPDMQILVQARARARARTVNGW